MSILPAPSPENFEAITDKAQLVSYLESGCKPQAQWRIGTEHEKFVFDLETLKPVPYDGARGIRALLEGLRDVTGWKPSLEGANIIGLSAPGGASVSLEPGGQLELSGAPLASIHETFVETRQHIEQVKVVCEKLGLGILGTGFHPTARREDISWMPKGRYKIMREYMPKKGGLGLDMMTRTCTVQVNLDFSDEGDMVRKMRVGLALQPLATALFANSPIKEGRVNGYQSYRSHVWEDTDPDRTGDLPFVFESGFGFERYVDYILDVPMYFVYRDGKYIDVSGQSFRDFMAGKLAALPGERPRMGDWADHLTTAFPEVRLKKYIEMRGADVGPLENICALPAFWTGLLYDKSSLDAAWNLIKDWSREERAALRATVPKLGIKTPFRNTTVQDLSRQVLRMSEAGLVTRSRLDATGHDESCFLGVLKDIVASGETAADKSLAAANIKTDNVFKAFSY